MLLRDRLHARLREMGDALDYVRLAEAVLAIRNATPSMARRLVDQALVVEDRRHPLSFFPTKPDLSIAPSQRAPLDRTATPLPS